MRGRAMRMRPAALDSGQVGHATLDVVSEEPLPPTHPFWRHPKVTLTPHNAGLTWPPTAAKHQAYRRQYPSP
jgi:glyoxylate/hydroxypyruvate reductase